MTDINSNPFSTGGGGTRFETLVGAFYLVSLLAADTPRGLNDGITQNVGFQRRWDGSILDDVVVTSKTATTVTHKIVIQVKHQITISPNDETFRKVLSDCWTTFSGTNGSFEPNKDRLGIATGSYTTKVDGHLQRLFQWARTSNSADEFQRIRIEGFSSREMREYLTVYETTLNKIADRSVTQDEIWKFLRCFVYLHFDFEHEGGHDQTYVHARLLDQLRSRNAEEVTQLLSTLQTLVSTYSISGGSIDGSTLRSALANYPLKENVNYSSDLERLRLHSDRTLRRIHTTIGNQIHLPRSPIFHTLQEATTQNTFIVILGEPGAGKSVLLNQLVDDLRQEGDILATSIDNITGVSIDEFTTNIGIEHDFSTLLSAFSAAPFRALFIDQLEKILLDENKRNILFDLINDVLRHNENLTRNSFPSEGQWRIVATCREEQYRFVKPLLVQNYDVPSITEWYIPKLELAEVDWVVEVFPSLQYLTEQDHIQDLVRNPFVLNFLTYPELSPTEQPQPKTLTESWLVERYWQEVIRNGEKTSNGKGNPDQREASTLFMGEYRLLHSKMPIPTVEIEATILGALVADGILHREEHRVTFVHDILDDWTISRIALSRRAELIQFLKKHAETLQLSKPIQLLALRNLELKLSGRDWSSLVKLFSDTSEILPRWRQIVLEAPLHSPLLADILPIIEPYLMMDDGETFTDFIRILRTVFTTSNDLFSSDPQLEARLSREEIAQLQAKFRKPINKPWEAFWNWFLIDNRKLPISSLSDFAEAAYLWMEQDDNPLRREVSLFCLKLLDHDFREEFNDIYYKNDDTITISSRDGSMGDQVRKRLVAAVLTGADLLPSEVASLLEQLLDEHGNRLAHLLFERDSLIWVPLAKHLPQVLIEIFLKIFLEPQSQEEDEFYYRDAFDRRREFGIRNDHIWRYPPDPKQDRVFYLLLYLQPNYGIQLINRLVNHTTKRWAERQLVDQQQTPLPQQIVLSSGTQKVWGDSNVYTWYRDYAPHTVTLALLSLKQWLDEVLKDSNAEQAARLFNTILDQSESVAIVGMCVSAAAQNAEKFAFALVPILEQPAFWLLDKGRVQQNMVWQANLNQIGFDQFTIIIMTSNNNQARERLQAALKGFPSRLPFFFEHSREDEGWIKHIQNQMQELAALSDLNNYSRQKYGQGTIVTFTYPQSIIDRKNAEAEAAGINELRKIMSLQTWAGLTLSNKLPEHLSLEAAMALALEFDQELNNDDEYVPRKSAAVIEACAALIVYHLDWLLSQNYFEWSRQKLLDSVFRVNPDTNVSESYEGFANAEAALPALIRHNNEDQDAKRAILHFALYAQEYSLEKLFAGLTTLWESDPDFVWICLNFLLEKAKFIRARHISDYEFAQEDSRLEFEFTWITKVPELSTLDAECSYYLHPMLSTLPFKFGESQKELSGKLLQFIDEVILYNTKINRYSQLTQQDNHHHQLFQVPWEWGRELYPRLAALVLYQPLEVVQKHILDPVILAWEKASEPLVSLLNRVLSYVDDSTFESRFIALWKQLIPTILESRVVTDNPSGFRNQQVTKTLAALILIHEYGLDVWKERAWNPSSQLTAELTAWVEKVGYYEENFSNLVKMLSTVGKPVAFSHGLQWLDTCFRSVDNPRHLFSDNRDRQHLAELLLEIWSQHETELRKSGVQFNQFVVFVEYLATQGVQLAVELQRQLSA